MEYSDSDNLAVLIIGEKKHQNDVDSCIALEPHLSKQKCLTMSTTFQFIEYADLTDDKITPKNRTDIQSANIIICCDFSDEDYSPMNHLITCLKKHAGISFSFSRRECTGLRLLPVNCVYDNRNNEFMLADFLYPILTTITVPGFVGVDVVDVFSCFREGNQSSVIFKLFAQNLNDANGFSELLLKLDSYIKSLNKMDILTIFVAIDSSPLLSLDTLEMMDGTIHPYCEHRVISTPAIDIERDDNKMVSLYIRTK